MNFERIYAYRFRDIDQGDRETVWHQVALFIHERLGSPQIMLDPAAGLGEFIRHSPSREKWAIDRVDFGWAEQSGVHLALGDNMTADVPADYFDGIWVSNFLEHLPGQEEVAAFLEHMLSRLKPGGRLAVMGPNFKYCYREYFDCADHTVALSHLGAAEHLFGAGFELESVVPRFLPYSFRGRLPAGKTLIDRYLATPWAWRFLGKQFLIIARRPTL